METYKNWEEQWQQFQGLNFFGKILAKSERKIMKKIFKRIRLPSDSKLIDIGCGTGKNLIFLRNEYENSIGIDISKTGLRICEKANLKMDKDIFNMNATDIKYESKSFNLVFSDGLLEHFKDFTPFVKEMCRISNKYILLFQPNHFSLYGRLMSFLKRRTIKEFSYKIKDYTQVFHRYGFDIDYSGNYNFGEHFTILFIKRIENTS